MIGKQPTIKGYSRFFQKHLQIEFPPGITWDSEIVGMLMFLACGNAHLLDPKKPNGFQRHFLEAFSQHPKFCSRFYLAATEAIANHQADWSVLNSFGKLDKQLGGYSVASITAARARLVKEDKSLLANLAKRTEAAKSKK